MSEMTLEELRAYLRDLESKEEEFFTSEQDYDSYGQMTQHGFDKLFEARHEKTMSIIEEGRKQSEETQKLLKSMTRSKEKSASES